MRHNPWTCPTCNTTWPREPETKTCKGPDCTCSPTGGRVVLCEACDGVTCYSCDALLCEGCRIETGYDVNNNYAGGGVDGDTRGGNLGSRDAEELPVAALATRTAPDEARPEPGQNRPASNQVMPAVKPPGQRPTDPSRSDGAQPHGGLHIKEYACIACHNTCCVCGKPKPDCEDVLSEGRVCSDCRRGSRSEVAKAYRLDTQRILKWAGVTE